MQNNPGRGGGGWYCHIWAIYIGMCCCEGYGFQAVFSRIGYKNQSVWVQNRVSFFRKLISWLKILSRLGKQLLQDRGIWGVYSSIGQQNLAELALVQVKGSRVPAAHPHPEIPKVPPARVSTLLTGFPFCYSSLPVLRAFPLKIPGKRRESVMGRREAILLAQE